MKKIISTLLIILIFSCAGENNSEVKKETKFVGFYDLKGAVEFVNGIAVDTILSPDRRQTKFFSEDGSQHMWINNQKAPEGSPWISGQGVYGEGIMGENTLTEIVKENFGGRAPIFSIPMDTLKKFWHDVDTINRTLTWKTPIVYKDENSFSQLSPGNQDGSRLSEYYEKVEEGEKTDLDGVWLRKGTINYVNNVAIDTVFIKPTDLLQIKFYHRGRLMFFTRDYSIEDTSLASWYGLGMYGTFSYENGRLTEQMDYGLYGNEQWFKNLPDKDENGESLISFNVNLDENSYSQTWPQDEVYSDLGFGATAEYYERLR
tara:strand:+ start:16 stop:966 length:951 start_codon:yes stop_codon:yes gene_type:complete